MTKYFKKWFFVESTPDEELALEFREALHNVVKLSQKLGSKGLSIWVKWNGNYFTEYGFKRLEKIEISRTNTEKF